MSEPMTARDHALKVAALEAAAHAFTDAYEKARAEAEPVFAAKYTDDGNDRQMVLLPSGEKVSQVTIKTPAPSARLLEDRLEAWAAGVIGDGAFEEYILPAAIGTAQVIDAVKAAHPELVKRRLRPGTARKLAADAVKGGGWLQDDETGEKAQVAEISTGTVTGAFAFTGNDSAPRRARLMEEILSGRLRDVIGPVLGPLPVLAGDEAA
jgi:hypothetical protein